MNPERINQLEKLIAEDPSEPFLHYALALEWAASDLHLDKAIERLIALQDSHPAYLPLYYQLAALHLRKGDKTAAASVAAAGLELANRQGNRHTASEIRFLLEDAEE